MDSLATPPITEAGTAGPAPDDAAISEQMRLALGPNQDGVDLYVAVDCRFDGVLAPFWAHVKIDHHLLVTIKRRHAVCMAEQLGSVSQPRSPWNWDTTSALRVKSWTFSCSSTDFWFDGRCANDTRVKTAPIPTWYLIDWLAGRPASADDPVQGENHFAWAGGVLMYHPYDLDDFVEQVLARHPEIHARETATVMAHRISASTSTTTSASPPLQAQTSRSASPSEIPASSASPSPPASVESAPHDTAGQPARRRRGARV